MVIPITPCPSGARFNPFNPDTVTGVQILKFSRYALLTFYGSSYFGRLAYCLIF